MGKKEAYWTIAPKELFELFNTSEEGLKSEDAEQRLKEYSLNEIEESKTYCINIFGDCLISALIENS